MGLKKKRITKKRLKEPDEFITSSARIVRWFADNQKVVLSCALIIIVIFLISYTYARNKANKGNQAFMQFYKGVAAYKNLTYESAEKDISAVSALFENIAKEVAGTSGARYAELYMGHTYYKNGKYEKAVESYKNVLKISGEDSIASPIAKEGLAYSYFALKRYKESINIFNEIIESGNPLSKRDIYLTIADVYQSMEDNESAAKILEKVIQEFPADPENDNLKDRISTLKNG